MAQSSETNPQKNIQPTLEKVTTEIKWNNLPPAVEVFSDPAENLGRKGSVNAIRHKGTLELLDWAIAGINVGTAEKPFTIEKYYPLKDGNFLEGDRRVNYYITGSLVGWENSNPLRMALALMKLLHVRKGAISLSEMEESLLSNSASGLVSKIRLSDDRRSRLLATTRIYLKQIGLVTVNEGEIALTPEGKGVFAETVMDIFNQDPKLSKLGDFNNIEWGDAPTRMGHVSSLKNPNRKSLGRG